MYQYIFEMETANSAHHIELTMQLRRSVSLHLLLKNKLLEK